MDKYEGDPASRDHKLDQSEPKSCDGCGRVTGPMCATPHGIHCISCAMAPSMVHVRLLELERNYGAISDQVRDIANRPSCDARLAELAQQIDALTSKVFKQNLDIKNLAFTLKSLTVAGADILPQDDLTQTPHAADAPHIQAAPATPPEWKDGSCDYGGGLRAWLHGGNVTHWIEFYWNDQHVGRIHETAAEAQSACDAFVAAVRGEKIPVLLVPGQRTSA